MASLTVTHSLCIGLCMATKTISVDLEAYEHLRRAKSSNRESFSQVIKRAVWEPKTGTANHLLRSIRSSNEDERVPKSGLDRLDRLQELDTPARNPREDRES